MAADWPGAGHCCRIPMKPFARGRRDGWQVAGITALSVIGMLSVEEALALVVQHSRPLPPQMCSLSRCLGMRLAEPIVSDVDSPPYDKSLMDGYAVRSSDLAAGQAELHVVEEVTAGDVPRHALKTGEATRIMTGAPLPQGADAVVMVEESELLAGDPPRVRLTCGAPVKPEQNILRAGVCMRQGEEVLSPGRRLRAGDVGLLAEVGRDRVMVYPRPQVAVLSTGNELVPAGAKLGPGQIRNSNGPMLLAMAESAGCEVRDLGIARDDPEQLHARISQGLQGDALVLSGGVSAGVMDLIPQTLQRCGVEAIFHKVLLRPGKPLWFGVHAERGTLVFGLPGNPVSSFVCFHLFARLALQRMAGNDATAPPLRSAQLEQPFQQRGERPTWHPAEVREADGRLLTQTVRWQGSADLRALARAQGLIYFPAGTRAYAAGEEVQVLPFESY